MRTIHIEDHKGKVSIEVRWMWLPTFIGQNSHLLQMLDKALTEEFPTPFEATEEKLDEIHSFVIDWFGTVVRVPGLTDYIRAIEKVPEGK